MMQEVLTINLSVNELKQVIKECLSSYNNNFNQAKEFENPISQQEAATYLDVSQATLIKLKKTGKIPFEKVPGSNKVRYYKSELRAALRSHEK